MTKAEIISKISERTGVEKTTASVVVESLMLEIKESIKQDESVFLRGFICINPNFDNGSIWCFALSPFILISQIFQ